MLLVPLKWVWICLYSSSRDINLKKTTPTCPTMIRLLRVWRGWRRGTFLEPYVSSRARFRSSLTTSWSESHTYKPYFQKSQGTLTLFCFLVCLCEMLTLCDDTAGLAISGHVPGWEWARVCCYQRPPQVRSITVYDKYDLLKYCTCLLNLSRNCYFQMYWAEKGQSDSSHGSSCELHQWVTAQTVLMWANAQRILVNIFDGGHKLHLINRIWSLTLLF